MKCRSFVPGWARHVGRGRSLQEPGRPSGSDLLYRQACHGARQSRNLPLSRQPSPRRGELKGTGEPR